MKSDPTEYLHRMDMDTALQSLQSGGIIAYPSDSLWGIGCDATNEAAKEKLSEIKERPGNKSFITLVSSERQLQQVVQEIPDLSWDLLDAATEPLTIIYPKATTVFRHLASEDGKIAVRLVTRGFCNELITRFKKPLISTSANLSGQPAAIHASGIPEVIRRKLDYIVKTDEPGMTGRPSKIVELSMNGQVKVIR